MDVQLVGQNGTCVGLAAFNVWFHGLTGVHMFLYAITDWLGLVPVADCLGFEAMGATQLVRRRSLFAVDYDLLLLGVCYVLIAAAYLVFEAFPINYRPIPVDGVMEASYPSSTALLVLGVMPTVAYQIARRSKSIQAKVAVVAFVAAFSPSLSQRQNVAWCMPIAAVMSASQRPSHVSSTIWSTSAYVSLSFAGMAATSSGWHHAQLSQTGVRRRTGVSPGASVWPVHNGCAKWCRDKRGAVGQAFFQGKPRR